MPITRSNKGSSKERPIESTVQPSSSEATETTSYETYDTSATVTTQNTKLEEATARTLIENRPASKKSQRRRERAARAELAEKELREAQAAAAAARLRLELIQAENEEHDDSVIEEPKDREDHVTAWVQTSAGRIDKEPVFTPSQFYSESTPEDVLESLRRCYGRAGALVLAELDRIRKLPTMSDSAYDICSLASNVNNTVVAIRGLRKPQYLMSPELLRSIVDKMPTILRYRWYDHIIDKTEGDPDLNTMCSFLNKMADRCRPYAVAEIATKRQPTRRQTTYGTAKPPCPQCKEEHPLYECPKYKGAKVQERWEMAKESRLCYKCLDGKHRKQACRLPPCRTCKRWHHHSLHNENPEAEPAENSEVANNVRLPVNCARTSRAYLKIALEVYGPSGSTKVLALLDEGSTVTLLDANVAKQVGLKRPKESLRLETEGWKTKI